MIRTTARPLAASKGGKRRYEPKPVRDIPRTYGDIGSRGTDPALVADEMACQRSMAERGRRLMLALLHGRHTPTVA